MPIMVCPQLQPLLFFAALLFGWAHWYSLPPDSLSRRSFPPDFVFGAATSAYQVEGAVSEGGRGLSIWDTFTKDQPDKIADGSNGSVAIDSYHRYKEDVGIMKDLGLDAYKFSISWSRILPNGKISGGINREGVRYYNNLIDELISKGVKPYATIFHWDVPQALEDEYGGFLSPQIVDDFKIYADICFRLFGDRVKHWITLNEPWTFAVSGYAEGLYAPGRCSSREWCHFNSGDSGREPYIVGHHQLLAHAATFKLYVDKYKASQNGSIGITVNSFWFVPYSDSKSDFKAATRALDFMLGWFMDPLTQGSYPLTMRALVQDRLPQFTVEQSKMMQGSFDFIGINYYTSYFAKDGPIAKEVIPDYDVDMNLLRTAVRNGIPIGPMAASTWIYVYPVGLYQILHYIKRRYNNPIIYVTENGVDETNNITDNLQNALADSMRIEFYKEHLEYVQMATREGVNIQGYFAWSLFDNFEWEEGYTVRFGLYYVDYKTLNRYPKSSAFWFRKFLES